MTALGARLALLIAFMLPGAAAAQTLGQGGEIELPLLRLAIGLFLCSIVAIFAAVAMKRFMRGGLSLKGAGGRALFNLPARKVQVLETQRLSPHADICVITCESRQYVVVVSPGAATILREDAAPANETAP